MYLRSIGRRFTQMIAYFLVMNSKRITLRINEVTIFLKFVFATKFSVTHLPNNIWEIFSLLQSR